MELAALAGTTLTYSISTSKGDNADFVQIVPDQSSDRVDDDDEEEECFTVSCPEGVLPGELLYITTPHGHEIEFAVPEVPRARLHTFSQMPS